MQNKPYEQGQRYWVKTEGWLNCDGIYTNRTRYSRPGLVCKRSARLYAPVYMIPGTTSTNFPVDESDAYAPRNSSIDTDHYLLEYITPVDRKHIERPPNGLEKNDLKDFQKKLTQFLERQND